MMRFVMTTLAAVLLGCGSALAQVGGMSISPGPSPLGITSPLGIGPGSPVAPAGIPLGATELAPPGVSPMTSGTSPLGLNSQQHHNVFRHRRCDPADILRYGELNERDDIRHGPIDDGDV